MRSIEDPCGRLVLHMHAMWRSRDLFKAWGDNLIGITNLQAWLAARLAALTKGLGGVGPVVGRKRYYRSLTP